MLDSHSGVGSQPEPATGTVGMAVSHHQYAGGTWDESPDPAADGPHTLLLVFGSRAFGDSESGRVVLSQLVSDFPNSVLLGCSSAGEILGTETYDDSITLAVVRFESTRVRLASAGLPDAEHSRAAGEELARALSAPDLRAVLVLAPGVGINGSDLVRGLNTTLGPDVVVTGGLAGDAERFVDTWVVAAAPAGGPALAGGAVAGRPTRNLVAAVGLYGPDLVVGHGSRGGWSIFGPERIVTKSAGNVLYELDGKPALELYRAYLGDFAAGLPATAMRFPLAIRESSEATKNLVRSVLSLDEETQAMHFAGDIPQGWRAQLMWATSEQLVTGAEQAAAAINLDRRASGDVLAVAISCVGRRIVLGQDIDAELEAVSDRLELGLDRADPMASGRVTQVGFYSYGELAPYESGPCDLHNQTMTLTVLAEA